MFNLTKGAIVIRVDFPALDNLVALLRDNQQAEIDATTATIKGLTQRLKTSSDKLKQATNQTNT